LVPVSIKKTERVIRSDVSEAHRLSLSARVLSAQYSQVKAKTALAEALPTNFEIRRERVARKPETAGKPRITAPVEAMRPSGSNTTLGRDAFDRHVRRPARRNIGIGRAIR
jgi:hypothetical protein